MPSIAFANFGRLAFIGLPARTYQRGVATKSCSKCMPGDRGLALGHLLARGVELAEHEARRHLAVQVAADQAIRARVDAHVREERGVRQRAAERLLADGLQTLGVERIGSAAFPAGDHLSHFPCRPAHGWIVVLETLRGPGARMLRNGESLTFVPSPL